MIESLGLERVAWIGSSKGGGVGILMGARPAVTHLLLNDVGPVLPPQFRKALLREAIELMLSGDEQTGRAILRNYINATVGFQQLEAATSIPATSLMRMFGPNGNPSAKNLFGVLAHLQTHEGVHFEIRPRRT